MGEKSESDEEKTPDFSAIHYTNEDYAKWDHINRIREYLIRHSVCSVSEAKYLISLKHEDGKTPLHRAAENNDLNAVKSLVALGADVNARNEIGKTPLHYAVAGGSTEVVDALLSFRADYRAKDNEGQTLLHVAAEYCQPKILTKLLEMGLRHDETDMFLWAPLHKASWSGCVPCAKSLIEKGVDQIDALTDTKATSLILAIGRKHTAVAELLLAAGANPNAKPDNGWTPLHRAAAMGNVEAVKLLLNRNADMYMKDNFGRTPMELAIEANNQTVVAIFTKKGYVMHRSKSEQQVKT